MKILVVNAILYTNESTIVKKVDSVKDCMICDLCNAFTETGHDVTLIAAEEYKPLKEEKYSFNIVWLKSYFKKIFSANKIPFNLGIIEHLEHNEYDLIISSEVFSLDTFLVAMKSPRNLIIWQEMAFHQKMCKQMASKIWHNFVVRIWYKNIRIVARTDNAKQFIERYCNNVSETVIQHGIDLEKFQYKINKSKSFIVSSQLIARKRIENIIVAFSEFCRHVNYDYKLFIAGDGDCKKNLENLCKELNLNENVFFLGKLPHNQLVEYLSDASAMLVSTAKDNSLISIAESIAVGTPVVTNSVPDNAKYISENELGIVVDFWGWNELNKAIQDNRKFVDNCISYRQKLDNKYNVDLFLMEHNRIKEKVK